MAGHATVAAWSGRAAAAGAGLGLCLSCGVIESYTPERVPPQGVPSAVVIQGRALPYAGAVPWTKATATTDSSVTLTIYGDADAATSPNWCGLPEEIVRVVESASQVRIAIDGYAERPDPGGSCGAVGHAPQPLGVTLEAPLGDRDLVDAYDGTSRSLET